MFKERKTILTILNFSSDRQHDDETDVSLKHPIYFIGTWWYEAKIVQLDMIFIKP